MALLIQKGYVHVLKENLAQDYYRWLPRSSRPEAPQVDGGHVLQPAPAPALVQHQQIPRHPPIAPTLPTLLSPNYLQV